MNKMATCGSGQARDDAPQCVSGKNESKAKTSQGLWDLPLHPHFASALKSGLAEQKSKAVWQLPGEEQDRCFMYLVLLCWEHNY